MYAGHLGSPFGASRHWMSSIRMCCVIFRLFSHTFAFILKCDFTVTFIDKKHKYDQKLGSTELLPIHDKTKLWS